MNKLAKVIFIFQLLLGFLFPLFGESLPMDADLNKAHVTSLKITAKGNNKYLFSVTVRHLDAGWDHYADAWEVIDRDTGKVLATRILQHPHVDEQPFTRSLDNIVIPDAVKVITIRAKCNLHGYTGTTISVQKKDLPKKGQSLITQ